MTELGALMKRNCKLFFKDKGMFFTSLITPLILLVLYATFLGNVYHQTFTQSIPEDVEVTDGMAKAIDAMVGGQLLSSLLAVCCVTVAFCSNMIMVQDKVNGARSDLTMTPVKKSTLAVGYYVSTALNTLIICFIAAGAGFAYLASLGWFLTGEDVACILLDVFLLVIFGTALSSIVNVFLSSQGQISAVGSIVSSVYGFICGAYMPISNFSKGLQTVLSFLPGTFGTSLLRNHAINGSFDELSRQGLSDDLVNQLRDVIDCNIYFFDEKVPLDVMYIVLACSAALFVAVYIVINILRRKAK